MELRNYVITELRNNALEHNDTFKHSENGSLVSPADTP